MEGPVGKFGRGVAFRTPKRLILVRANLRNEPTLPMSLSAARKRIDLPDDVDRDELGSELEDWLRSSEEVKRVHRHDRDESVTIRAETATTLLTWGQEIEVTLEPGEALVEVTSPDQWFDWGKSDKKAEAITRLLNEDRADPDQVPA